MVMLFSFIALLILIAILPKKDSDQSFGINDSYLSYQEFDEYLLDKVSRWKAYLNSTGITNNSPIFADSLAELYFEMSNYDSAAKYFEIAVTLESNNKRIENAAIAYFNLFMESMNPDGAKIAGENAANYFSQLLNTDPANNEWKMSLALIYLSGSGTSKGEQFLREIINDDPQNTEALYHLGIMYYQNGKYEEAGKLLERVIESEHENVLAHYHLGVVYKQLGKNEEARKQLMVVGQLDPGEETEANVALLLKELTTN